MTVGQLMVLLGKFPIQSHVVMETQYHPVTGFSEITSVEHEVRGDLEMTVIITDYIETAQGAPNDIEKNVQE